MVLARVLGDSLARLGVITPHERQQFAILDLAPGLNTVDFAARTHVPPWRLAAMLIIILTG